MYAVVSDWEEPDAGLVSSEDKESGHRYDSEARGVYGHYDNEREKAVEYARPVPLFGDGTYVQVVLQLVVDRTWRVKFKHKNQKVNEPNSKGVRLDPDSCPGGPSIFYKSLWVRHVGYQHLPNGVRGSSGILLWRLGQVG